jgi:hypothetical protein
LAGAQLAPGTKRWIASAITLIAAIAKQIDVRNAVAITKAWVLGSSLMAAEIEYSLWSHAAPLSTPRANLPLLVSSYMSDVPAPAIVCPHCKKTFDGELLAEGSRHEGFKCPHCRLFVPAERANGDDGASS